jgi:preprotein translocase subunit SecB
MSNIEPSKFKFINFWVKESVFKLHGQADLELSFNLQPSGRIFPHLNQFELDLHLIISDRLDLLRIEVKSVSIFEVDDAESLSVDNKFLLINAPAIVYPYLRAYVATLTAQSGINALHLPAMNLTPMGEVLRKNISVIADGLAPSTEVL